MGADVIKVERPKGGDEGRGIGPFAAGGASIWFMQQNFGKRSLSIDLKAAEGVELVRRLCANADVIVENFRSGALDRLGLGYEALRGLNPGLVYCSISAFGRTGPYAGRPGYGPLVEALGGVTDQTGEAEGPPMPSRYMTADVIAASHAFGGICAALVGRGRTGQGDHIDIALYDCVLEGHDHPFVQYFASGGTKVLGRRGLTDDQIVPLGVFPVGGRHIAIHLATDAGWAKLAAVMGRPEWARDPDFASIAARRRSRAAVEAAIVGWLAGIGEAGKAVAILHAAGVPAEPVQSIDEIARDPQARARGAFVRRAVPGGEEIDFVNVGLRTAHSATGLPQKAPALGEHTREVLAELGCDAGQIDAMLSAGIAHAGREATGATTAP
jgi:crotonobetainyl-CoA:carnitine CoA-transferase CaiB-like acyl-CoA transferase